jgi:predicted AlkP superfamily phosphohydrolase/phosphomutase
MRNSLSETNRGGDPGRVMVIAWDGATWDLIRPWMRSGLLPNLARLVAEGTSAEMQAELPPSSVPNWPAFMTGKNAGKHGCVWWLQRDSTGHLDQLPIDSRSVHGDTLWSYLSTQGRKVIVLNVPVTYPVEPVNGVMVSGLLTPRGAEDFVYPSSAKTEIDAAVGGYRIYPEGGYARGREESFLAALVANMRQHAQAADTLLRTHPWDFFMLVLGPTDEGAHKYWHYMDPSHRRHNPSEAARLGDSLLSLYRAADEAVGLLVQHLRPEDTLIVMSDHGFGPVERFFLPNNLLMRQGYLKLRRSGGSLVKQALFRAGFTPRNVYPIGKQLLTYLSRSNRMRQRLDPGRQGRRSPLRRVFLSEDDIDWSQTRVAATGFLCAQLHINLRGRQPTGTVEPSEYEELRQRLIAEFSAVVDPQTGRPHYAKIYRREELYHGPLLESMPDLICLPADLRTADAGMDFRARELFATDSAISGTHRIEGIVVMRGPGVRAGASISPVRIYDFAPTILYRMGVPVPEDMDGQVMFGAFEDNALSAKPVEFMPAGSSRPEAQSGYSEEDELTVKERLRDLGYLS